MKKFLIACVCGFCVLLLIGMCVGGDKKEDPAIDDVDTVVPNVSATSAEPEKKIWQHDEQKDEMRGSTDTWDYIISDNEVNFDFPYDGGSTLRIDVRHMKKYGTDVLISISKGQFGGNEFSGTNYVTIKFDNEPLKKYYFNTADNGDSETIFMKKKSELISKFRTAKKIMVEAPFFDSGNQQFTFTVDVPYKGK